MLPKASEGKDPEAEVLGRAMYTEKQALETHISSSGRALFPSLMTALMVDVTVG